MTYTVRHVLFDGNLKVTTIKDANSVKFRFAMELRLLIQFPGQLNFSTQATIFVKKNPATPNPGGGQTPKNATEKTILLRKVIKKPDGTVFTGNRITLKDIKQFRDLRGTTQGKWTFTVEGESETVPVVGQILSARVGQNHIHISVVETITSKSAPLLVNDSVTIPSTNKYQFDLFRVGTFNAAASIPFQIDDAKMQLVDPDGVMVAESGNGRLTYPVTLRTIEKSRDANGNPRLWSLGVTSLSQNLIGKRMDVKASVIETARFNTNVLLDRIHHLFGIGLSQLLIDGKLTNSDIIIRLKILNEVATETLDMHDLLDELIVGTGEADHPVLQPEIDIQKNEFYTLYRASRKFSVVKVSEFELKVQAINIAIGASEKIQPSLPVLKLEVLFDKANAAVTCKGFDIASARIRDNRISLEAGIRLNADSTFSPEVWVEGNRLAIDFDNGALVAAAAALTPLGAAITVSKLKEKVNEGLENFMTSAVTKIVTGVAKKMPQTLAVILGDDFTYRALHLEGDTILLDYPAPLEPEPKPSKNHGYLGIIGRSATQLGPTTWRVNPLFTGDTWNVPNLSEKIDHIVVIMMENRSFDHVLGYRAQLPNVNSDGLTEELIRFLNKKGFQVPKLHEAKFKASKEEPDPKPFKTQFPRSVPHDLAAVTRQLKIKTKMPSGRTINSPQGFIGAFREAHRKLAPEDLQNVLGYYEGRDLPFHEFLAKNYAFCERFYSSHPGPTLPNRMFLLTGDVQYDRTGEAILDNNNSDNFYLSRAMTIFDLLTRKGIGWRVYESPPSVAMLRMFARYATDNINIVDIARLREDVAREKENFPAVTFIEPAMHHHPPNDDHAPADMNHGQHFLKGVYEALTSEEKLWRKTMLVITYDEHGGFYDHVIPPIADILTRPGQPTEDIETAGGHFTPPSLPISYGVRVPTFVVSPWVPAGKGPDITLDFCSITKTIIARFCGQDRSFLSARIHESRTLDSFLSETQPRMTVQGLPDLPPLEEENTQVEQSIITKPISREQIRKGNVDYHDLTGMLARLLGR